MTCLLDVGIFLAWKKCIKLDSFSATEQQDIHLYSETLTQNCSEVWGIYRGCRECVISIINRCLHYFLNNTAINITGLHRSHLRPKALRLTCQTITYTQILKILNSAARAVYFTVSVQYSRTLCTWYQCV